METISHFACPICHHEHLNHHVVCKDYTVSGQIFNIDVCNHCEAGITQAVPPIDKIGAYYQSISYISHSNTQEGLMNKVYHWVRNYMLQRKKDLIFKHTTPKTATLLDIGCGTGYFLNTLKNQQWVVTGIEPDDKARNFATEQFQLTVLPPKEMKLLKDQSFKVITLWHVLEHLHDLDGYWQEFGRLLKDDGLLVIAVPNHWSYDAKYYGKHWAAWDVPRHLWHFTPKSMTILAERFGFQLIDKEGMPFDSFYVALLSESYKKNPLKWFAGMWHGGISWLQSLLNVDKSSSIIYVFKKKQ
jgi:SAM-dependent methyltransferase